MILFLLIMVNAINALFLEKKASKKFNMEQILLPFGLRSKTLRFIGFLMVDSRFRGFCGQGPETS